MAVALDLVGVFAEDDVGDVARAEALVGARHGRHQDLDDPRAVGLGLGLAQADVAGAAVVGLEGLAEVFGEGAVAAGHARQQAAHVADEGDLGVQGLLVAAGLLGAAADELLPLTGVRGRIEQQALGGQTVAPGPARLLLVGLDRLGHVGVGDEADVRSVDAHAERDGGDDGVEGFVGEAFLDGVPLLWAQPGVVGLGVVALFTEFLGEAFCACPAQAVDDRAAAATVVHALDRLGELVGRLVAGADAVGQVGPVEGADEDLGVDEPELLGDVGAHAGRRGGGEGLHGDAGGDLAQAAEHAVLGAEVVPPLADAVGLVDRDAVELTPVVELGDGAAEAAGHRALGGDEQDTELAGVEPIEDGSGFVVVEGRVQGGRGVVVELEGADLVAHQGDERADDHGGAPGDERGDLVAERLAAARGQHGQAVASLDAGGDGGRLHGAEGVEPPDAAHGLGDAGLDVGLGLHWREGIRRGRAGRRGSLPGSGAQLSI